MRRFVEFAGIFAWLSVASASPAIYGPWEHSAAKVSLLVVAAHPDDEGIFFGGTLPYYALVRGLKVAAVDMVTDYTDLAPADLRGRKDELRNAVWHAGVRLAPVFGEFLDNSFVPGGVFGRDGAWDAWDGNLLDGVADRNGNGVPDGREAGARFVARQIRLYRPEVVVSHDVNGEYGHGAHKATAQASIEAFALAADPDVDIDGLPAWGARKLYLHLFPHGRLFHANWETPYPELTGRTARQVADEALNFHVSQGAIDVSTFYRSDEPIYDGYDAERWGLYASRVGNDPLPSTPPAGRPAGYYYGDFLTNVPDPARDTFRRGDANGDGAIGFDDLLALAQQYGRPSQRDGSVADFNLDGRVNFDDLLTFVQNYGSAATLADAATFATDGTLMQSQVPEPGMALVVLGFGTMRHRRRRQVGGRQSLPLRDRRSRGSVTE